MSRPRLARLRQMSGHEWRWRTRELVHTLVERGEAATGARWSRHSLARILSEPARAACGDDIGRGRWLDVQRALVRRMCRRPSRFVLDPLSASALRDRVIAHWPEAPRTAAACADGIVDGRIDLLGYPQLLCARGDRIGWHTDPVHQRTAPRTFYGDVQYLNPEFGDHKVIWELNRHNLSI